MTLPTFLLLSIVLVLWGSAFPAIRAALTFYPPLHLAAFRFLVASLVLGLICWRKGFPKVKKRDVPFFLVNGIVGVGFYNLFLNNGQRSVDSGVASLLVNTAPLWTALWAVFFLKEKTSAITWIGLVISFIGVVLVTHKNGPSVEWNYGAFLILGASLAHSIYIVLMKRNADRYGALTATTFAVWAGTAFLLLFSRGWTDTLRCAPFTSTLIVVYLGLFPAAVAYVLWGAVLNRMTASKAVSFLFLVPIFAFIIAGIWLKERPTRMTFIGGALILIGVTVVNRTRPTEKTTHAS